MAERVHLAASSWGPTDDGGLFVALPVLTSDCTVKSTRTAFGDRDPFQRGVLFFLLAGVSERRELATFLGVTDHEFVDIIARDLIKSGLAVERPDKSLAPTLSARRTFLSSPTEVSERHGRVMYAHDGTRGSLIVGPLTPDCRVEQVDVDENGRSWLSVGTEGTPHSASCLVPALPSASPLPLEAGEADRAVKDFLRRSRSDVSVLPVQTFESFSIRLWTPRWERLLVRVLPVAAARRSEGNESSRPQNRRSGRPDYYVHITHNLRSPHALTQLGSILRADTDFRETFRRELAVSNPRRETRGEQRPEEPREERPQAIPEPAEPEGLTTPVEQVIIDVSPGADLCRALTERLAVIGSSVHVPLLQDANEMTSMLRDRFAQLGFDIHDEHGRPEIFPLMPDKMVRSARDAAWADIDHLWVAFAAWVLLEHDAAITPIREVLPGLPAAVANEFWGYHVQPNRDVNLFIEYIRSIRKG